MELEIVMLSEASQTKRNTMQYHLYVEAKKKNDTNALILKTETDSQTWRLNLRILERRVVWRRDSSGVWDCHGHTAIFKVDNQQGSTV